MENSGFIFAYEFDQNNIKKLSNFNSLKNNYWLHLDNSSENARNWLYKNSTIPVEVHHNLTNSDNRPRFIQFENGFFITIRGINYNEGNKKRDMISLNVWFDKQKIITTREQKIRAVEETQKIIEKNNVFVNTSNILFKLIENILYNTASEVEILETQRDDVEESILDENFSSLRSKIIEIRKNIIEIKKHLVPQKEIFLSLHNLDNTFFAKNERSKFKELYYHYQSIIDNINTLRESIQISQEEFNSKLAEEMNRTLYFFSIIAALFLPLSFLTGLLGVNVGGMPGINSSIAFLIVCLICIVLIIGELIWLKKKKIL